jgi:O-antigen ligase
MLVISVLVILGYMLAVRFEETGQFRLVARIAATFIGTDMAVTARQQSFAGAWEQFARSPIVGDALEEETTRFYPHNVVLESFMATGIAGGLSFIALLSFALWAAYRLIKWHSEHAWVGVIFLQYLIGAQFSGAIYAATTMWTFIGATLALYYGTRASKGKFQHGLEPKRHARRAASV